MLFFLLTECHNLSEIFMRFFLCFEEIIVQLRSATVVKTYASVSGGHLPAFLQRLTAQERQWFQAYMLPLMPHGFARQHDGRAKHTTASRRKRKEKSDILVPLYPVLRQLVRVRQQLAVRTFQAITQARQRVEEGQA